MITITAPGRAEIGGNHTDHQHGRVLAAAVNLFCKITAERSGELKIIDERYGENSRKLIDGVMEYLRREGFAVGNFTAEISSEVLVGSGLSSSAAFEVAIGRVISELYNGGEIPDVTLAKAGQFAENVFLGKPSGLMDQMASALGGLVFIDFADPKEPFVKRINADFKGHALCVTDTKGSHSDLTADYADITREMGLIATHFGAEVLRDVDENDVVKNISILREKYGDRAVLRALHFYAENDRAKREADALESGDFDTFLRLVNESGNSSFMNLQNAYSLSNPRSQGVPLGLELSRRVLNGRGAARLHGGGFAGTIQAFVPGDLVAGYCEALDAVFGFGACRGLGVAKV